MTEGVRNGRSVVRLFFAIFHAALCVVSSAVLVSCLQSDQCEQWSVGVNAAAALINAYCVVRWLRR